MTPPQPQYMRGVPRQRAQRLLTTFPRWADVRIRGSEPREIRSIEQLLEWLDRYRERVVEKLVDEHTDAVESLKAARLDAAALDRGLRAIGIDRDDVLAADPYVAARVRADEAGREARSTISGRDAAAGPDA